MVNVLEKAQAIVDAEYSSVYFDGKDEGKAEGILQVARAMLHDGDSFEKVVRITGLPLEQVKKL